ncbi:MAG: MFS transporter [Propionibacteriaceae bacterium]|nr:MFS transporter [Propionibacteriaceae bacterium]
MSTTTPEDSAEGQLVFRKGRWIDGWEPENTAQWEKQGKKIANRNLGFSIYAEFLGFVVWQLWSIVAVQMQVKADGSPGPYGFAFSSSQVFWLIAAPSFVGATFRFPYTFLVSKLGGRNWTMVSASLLLIPTIVMSFAIANHPINGVGGTSWGWMMVVAALGGFGGGNFASSMANITFFFPQREKGWALGLNAAGGNIGAAVAQFSVPILISVTAGAVTGIGPNVKNLPMAGWFWIPFIVIAIVCAFLFMNNLGKAKADMAAYAVVFKDPHLWLMSLLYIGTFGSFIGLGGVFPKLINDIFPAYNTPIHIGTALIALSFLGPLVGSLARPYGGRLADRFGGSIITVIAFLVMAVGTITVILSLNASTPSFWAFLICFLVIFVATGMGNGSMYRMIPTVFAYKAGQMDAQHKSAGIDAVRQTSAALGIISAWGAYGGFLMPFLFNLSKNNFGDYIHVLWWLFFAYIIFLIILVIAYVVPYARKGTRV